MINPCYYKCIYLYLTPTKAESGSPLFDLSDLTELLIMKNKNGSFISINSIHFLTNLFAKLTICASSTVLTCLVILKCSSTEPCNHDGVCDKSRCFCTNTEHYGPLCETGKVTFSIANIVRKSLELIKLQLKTHLSFSLIRVYNLINASN